MGWGNTPNDTSDPMFTGIPHAGRWFSADTTLAATTPHSVSSDLAATSSPVRHFVTVTVNFSAGGSAVWGFQGLTEQDTGGYTASPFLSPGASIVSATFPRQQWNPMLGSGVFQYGTLVFKAFAPGPVTQASPWTAATTSVNLAAFPTATTTGASVAYTVTVPQVLSKVVPPPGAQTCTGYPDTLSPADIFCQHTTSSCADKCWFNLYPPSSLPDIHVLPTTCNTTCGYCPCPISPDTAPSFTQALYAFDLESGGVASLPIPLTPPRGTGSGDVSGGAGPCIVTATPVSARFDSSLGWLLTVNLALAPPMPRS